MFSLFVERQNVSQQMQAAKLIHQQNFRILPFSFWSVHYSVLPFQSSNFTPFICV
uniref:Uncharacterized protein n=1 Tax=Arundo donax TaxID=35708 RepID=A0A0A9A1G5_ARUDO